MSDELKRDASEEARPPRTELPILSQPGAESSLPMDRRQALKVMAIAAAAPSVVSCDTRG